ncbi:MAG: LysR family transcriptional regulator [Gammaproteobacteria bacterium]|jgi:LysR family transcriptional regulator, hydrogen peroxide-inducible genes activator|nr:LysR family transcriptional regulator [Gammaproteobacteria bacterium]MBT4492599.1 LysR family transcriptional regulator [Gammaproteobacteria bacterium]
MPAHLETHEIRVFKTVYEENGFNKAAEKLFVTQSAVSQTIANLEHKLDTVLFHRKPLKLTEAGLRLLQYAQTVLSEEETVLADLTNIKNGVLSNLHLAMNSTVNELFGAKLIREFCNAHPLTRLKISVMPSRQMITAVGSELWELGLGPFQQVMPDRFRTVPLFQETRQLVISKDRVDPSASAEDVLNQVPLIVSHLDDPDLRPTIDKLRDNFGTIWEVNDLSLRLDLLSNGLGMTYLDERLMDKHPELALLGPFPFSTIPLTYGIYYRRDKLLSAGAHQFIAVCEKFF